jgi:hypothetical protein
MLKTHRTAIGLVIVVLGSIAAGRPAYTQDGSSGKLSPSATVGSATGAFQQAQDDGRAPIGHRQPRPGDIAGDTGLSTSDRVLREEDDRIDRKLFICRGC